MYSNYLGVTCYVYPTQEAGTVPLYRQVNQMPCHALTTSTTAPTIPPPPMGMMGGPMMPQFHMMMAMYSKIRQWSVEGVIGYVSPQSAINRAISCCKCQ
jgi:hypothetical protein